MIILFSIIFVLGPILGFVYAWMTQIFGWQMLVSVSVGGFLSSGLVAVVFTCLYFTQVETDSEKIKRLKKEIAGFKKEMG